MKQQDEEGLMRLSALKEQAVFRRCSRLPCLDIQTVLSCLSRLLRCVFVAVARQQRFTAPQKLLLAVLLDSAGACAESAFTTCDTQHAPTG